MQRCGFFYIFTPTLLMCLHNFLFPLPRLEGFLFVKVVLKIKFL